VQLYEYKPFHKQLTRMARTGGAADIAYKQVVAAIDNWRRRKEASLSRTHHGENRLPHAVKYDLHGHHRLVTVEHEHARILVCVGSHDDVDRWLDANRGGRFVVNKRGQIDFTRIDDTPVDPTTLQQTAPEALRLAGPVLRQLPAHAVDLLGLPRKVLLGLQLITFELLVDNDDAWEIVHAQDYISDAQRSATLDAIDHLRHGRLKQAIARIEAYAEEATASPEAVVSALEAGTGSDTVANLSALNDEDFQQRFHNSGYTEWLLFLHPEQQKHVDARHNGPARLIGVSGSGKTCVLVHRASELAKRYPGEKILILVLNESLRQLLVSLIEYLCPEKQRQQIDVMRIYDYCYKVVKTVQPRATINPYDEISGEDLSLCWRDFTNRPHAISQSKILRSSIKAMNVDPWGYLHDELIWVRTGTGASQMERTAYLTAQRVGRSLHFPIIEHGRLDFDTSRTSTGFRADARARVLGLLKDYEEYMAVGGLLDEDGVALMAYEYRNNIPKHESLRARCVLVDEVQDCSTTQLGVISMIPTAAEDGLLFVGDPVQKVFPRQQSLKTAGIDIRGRAARLNTNYRNTREILDAAYPIIDAYRQRSPVPEDEILQPELACRNGPRPKLVVCSTAEEQWQCVEYLARHLRAAGSPSICVGSPRPAIQREPRAKRGVPAPPGKPKIDVNLLQISERNSWPAMGIEGKVKLDALAESVVGARFEDMKGFEFKNVLLVDLHDRRLVSDAIPREEHWRVAFQLYVAMTRAQEELWMFAVGTPSELLTPLGPHVDRLTPAQIVGGPDNPTDDSQPATGLDGSAARDATEFLACDHPTIDSTASSPADVTPEDKAGEEDARDGRQENEKPEGDEEELQLAQEDDDAERLELPFDPDATSTAEMIDYANEYREDPEIFEQIMLQLNDRDCTSFISQISALRDHWLQLVRRQNTRRLLREGNPEWPPSALVLRGEGLSGKVFPYAQGMLSFMGYRVGSNSSLTTMQRRGILTYVYLGELPRLENEYYMKEWGSPGSRKRLNKMKNAIMAFLRNAQRRRSNMAIAIHEWQEDLQFIYQAFG
jgi:hypothetical protein